MRLRENKGRHCLGVAGFMHDHAPALGLDPYEMYLLGLVHDIGYIYGAKGHSAAGGKLLHEQGYKLAKCVSWHGETPKNYMNINLVNEPPIELILLWMADCSINTEGEYVGYDERLADILKRYGELSINYINSVDIITYLKEWEKRNKDVYPSLAEIPKRGIR